MMAPSSFVVLCLLSLSCLLASATHQIECDTLRRSVGVMELIGQQVVPSLIDAHSNQADMDALHSAHERAVVHINYMLLKCTSSRDAIFVSAKLSKFVSALSHVMQLVDVVNAPDSSNDQVQALLQSAMRLYLVTPEN